jgi:hypothetical protein
MALDQRFAGIARVNPSHLKKMHLENAEYNFPQQDMCHFPVIGNYYFIF